MQKSIITLYHSIYGHTTKQAEAVHNGATSVSNIKAQLIDINQIKTHWDSLNNADAIIFGCPTYMGSISAQFKQFMEDSSKLWYTRAWQNKLAAGFTNSASLNGDKCLTLLELFTFASQHGMLWISLGLLPSSSSTAKRNDINRLGAYTGAMAQSDSDASPEISPPEGDLATARALGVRVAELALKFNN